MVKVSCWKSTRAWTYNWYLKSNRIHGLLSNLVYLIQKRDQGTPKSQIHKKQPSFYKLETQSRKIQNTFCTIRNRKYIEDKLVSATYPEMGTVFMFKRKVLLNLR